MFQILWRPLEGMDDRFPLRIGELDACHPFSIGNHFTSDGSVAGFRRQRTLENGSPDPSSPENLQHSSPVNHQSSLLVQIARSSHSASAIILRETGAASV